MGQTAFKWLPGAHKTTKKSGFSSQKNLVLGWWKPDKTTFFGHFCDLIPKTTGPPTGWLPSPCRRVTFACLLRSRSKTCGEREAWSAVGTSVQSWKQLLPWYVMSEISWVRLGENAVWINHKTPRIAFPQAQLRKQVKSMHFLDPPKKGGCFLEVYQGPYQAASLKPPKSRSLRLIPNEPWHRLVLKVCIDSVGQFGQRGELGHSGVAEDEGRMRSLAPRNRKTSSSMWCPQKPRSIAFKRQKVRSSAKLKPIGNNLENHNPKTWAALNLSRVPKKFTCRNQGVLSSSGGWALSLLKLAPCFLMDREILSASTSEGDSSIQSFKLAWSTWDNTWESPKGYPKFSLHTVAWRTEDLEANAAPFTHSKCLHILLP